MTCMIKSSIVLDASAVLANSQKLYTIIGGGASGGGKRVAEISKFTWSF